MKWFSNLCDNTIINEQFTSITINDQTSLLSFLNNNIITNPNNLEIDYSYYSINLLYKTITQPMVNNFNILL